MPKRIRILACSFALGVGMLLLGATAAHATPQSGAHVSGQAGGGYSPVAVAVRRVPPPPPLQRRRPPRPRPDHADTDARRRAELTPSSPPPSRPANVQPPARARRPSSPAPPAPVPSSTSPTTAAAHPAGHGERQRDGGPDRRRQHRWRRQHRRRRSQHAAGRGRRRPGARLGRPGPVRLPPLPQDGRLDVVPSQAQAPRAAWPSAPPSPPPWRARAVPAWPRSGCSTAPRRTPARPTSRPRSRPSRRGWPVIRGRNRWPVRRRSKSVSRGSG